jgi:hypothetical protein
LIGCFNLTLQLRPLKLHARSPHLVNARSPHPINAEPTPSLSTMNEYDAVFFIALFFLLEREEFYCRRGV